MTDFFVNEPVRVVPDHFEGGKIGTNSDCWL